MRVLYRLRWLICRSPQVRWAGNGDNLTWLFCQLGGDANSVPGTTSKLGNSGKPAAACYITASMRRGPVARTAEAN